MKITVDVEHLAEVSSFIKTCDEHWRGVLVAVLALVVVGTLVGIGWYVFRSGGSMR